MNKSNVDVVQLDPKTEYIKIHGLQRTGTNWLTHLMNENFHNTKALVNLGGWKHGAYAAPWMIGKEVHILGLVKNPYSWLVSVYDYWGPNKKLNIGPDLSGVTFDQFVRNRIIAEAQRDVPFLFRAANPVQLWNNWNFHWSSIRLNTKKLHFVTYESLLKNTNEVVNQIGQVFDIKRKTNEIVGSETTFTPSGETVKPSDVKFGKLDYYRNMDYMNHYTPDLLEFINNELDMDLMVNFGYNLVMSKEMAEKLQAKEG
jgi:hypothetical protein